MKLQYTNIEQDKAYILLSEEITNEYANYIANEMYYVAKKGYKIELKINSIGGSVFGGYSIIDAVKTCNADTHIIGIAASMAGIIALYGKNRKASEYARLMAHPPQGKEGELLELVREGLKTNLTNRTKLTEQEIDEILNSDKDKYFRCREMLDLGMIDSIEKDELLTPMLEDFTDHKNLYEYVNKQINNKMDISLINNALKLPTNASQEKAVETISSYVNQLEEKENEIQVLCNAKETLAEEVKNLKEEINKAHEAKVNDLISSYVDKKVIKEDQKEKYINLAKTDFELAKDILDGLSVTNVNPHDFVNQGGTKKLSEMTAEEKAELARKQPELYNKLVTAQ